MLEKPLHDQGQRSRADLARRWVNSIGLAVAVGVAYFLAARLGVGLLLEPEGVAVFWPAAGVSSGVLIALGPRARWPVAVGVTAATVVIHQVTADPLWAGIALGLSNAAEALIVAGLLELYFGALISTSFGCARSLAYFWRQSSAPLSRRSVEPRRTSYSTHRQQC